MSETEKAPRMTGEGRLPGDPRPEEIIARMIRVDQAGEFGAVRIYQGQRAVLGRRPATDAVLRDMEAQERKHLDSFDRLIAQRRVRPTLLRPLWDLAGYALGAGTALLGEKAAMACTVAVEEVIDAHYTGQLEQLGEDEAALRQDIAQFRDDERAHHDQALEQGAEQAQGYVVLTSAIKAGARIAIWLSERF